MNKCCKIYITHCLSMLANVKNSNTKNVIYKPPFFALIIVIIMNYCFIKEYTVFETFRITKIAVVNLVYNNTPNFYK